MPAAPKQQRGQGTSARLLSPQDNEWLPAHGFKEGTLCIRGCTRHPGGQWPSQSGGRRQATAKTQRNCAKSRCAHPSRRPPHLRHEDVQPPPGRAWQAQQVRLGDALQPRKGRPPGGEPVQHATWRVMPLATTPLRCHASACTSTAGNVCSVQQRTSGCMCSQWYTMASPKPTEKMAKSAYRRLFQYSCRVCTGRWAASMVRLGPTATVLCWAQARQCVFMRACFCQAMHNPQELQERCGSGTGGGTAAAT